MSHSWMSGLWALILLILSGCSEDTFRTYFELGDFRLMAIEATPPEIDGTATSATNVTLTPHFSDIEAGGRVVKVTIDACPDPGISLGADPSCANSSQRNPNLPAVPDVDLSTLAPTYTGAGPGIVVPVPAGLLSGRSAIDRNNGVVYLVTFRFEVGNETLDAFKRIYVADRASLNQSPSLNDVLIDGQASAAATLVDGSDLTPSLTAGAEPETYTFLDGQGNATSETERYVTTYFTYGGQPSLTRAFLDETAEFLLGAESTPFKLVVAVLRDGRGGVDVLTVQK